MGQFVCLLATLVAAIAFVQRTTGAPAFAIDPAFSEQYDNFEKPELLEGDIAGFGKYRTAKEAIEALSSGVDRNGYYSFKWENKILYYTISIRFIDWERERIHRAIEDINNHTTGLRLVERTDATVQRNYVHIQRGGPNTGCWSYVGQIGERQFLNLEVPAYPTAPHCVHHGTIMHELIHAIGFFHEQSRTDRDEYVDINWDNIEKHQQHNFEKYDSSVITAYGQPYDHSSLMHYGMYDFAINRSIWTIRPKPLWEDIEIGKAQNMSEVDINKINLMYPPQ
ncbi:hypothetical protein RvY_10346-2 [Ramazzottius varieornatus]|uniref:Metalloendopeptidase n=1 Tax=Ramazzottius varieornatus TaxID=947166 RepID=A0A1D1VK80_RAMVA|nr:hypothetical protein RvY_10346-2 [Ramazzottius varieornatus]